VRIAFITAQHWDVHGRGAATVRIHDCIAEDAARRGCSLTLLGGDLHERKSVAEERNAVAAWLVKMARLGEVVGVYGNHESPLDLEIYTKLEAENPITFYDRPAVHWYAGIAIACLPWPRPAHLLAELGPVSQEAGNQVATDALRAVLRGLGDAMDAAGVDGRGPRSRVFLGHVMARGSLTSTGQEMLGMPLELGLEDLALARADAYLLGHIHLGAGNEWQIGDAPAFYGGSPRRCTWGEPEVKSYTVLEFEDGLEGRLVSWERVPTPATRMAHVEAHWHGAHTGLPGDVTVPAGLSRDWSPEEVAGAEVRLRYVVEAPNREAAKRDAAEEVDALRAAGAVSVKVEEQVMASTRARTPEVARAVTLADKLGALWEARKDVPDPVRREALRAKLYELEDTHVG